MSGPGWNTTATPSAHSSPAPQPDPAEFFTVCWPTFCDSTVSPDVSQPATTTRRQSESFSPVTAFRRTSPSNTYCRWSRDLVLPSRKVRSVSHSVHRRVLSHHGLLNLLKRPTWRTVVGGSQTYVRAMVSHFRDRIRLRTPCRVYGDGGSGGNSSARWCLGIFDHVIFACHSDQALKLLGCGAYATEREILSAFPYTQNRPCCTLTSPFCRGHDALGQAGIIAPSMEQPRPPV